MVTMFVVSMSSTPVFAENSPPGNTFFEEWSESVSESDVVSELAGEPLDQQASFEAAVEIIEAIEAERMENAYIAEGPSLESILENGNYEALTPEQLWDTFLQEKATSSQLASASLAARYEFRTFTNEAFAGEERFAIYNSADSVVTGWEEDSNNPGKWWYKENGVKVVGWKWIGSNWYYFEDDDEGLHYMVHGWLLDDNSYYYLGSPGSPETGAMYAGNWLNDIEAGGTTADPKWYYMDADGKMHHGWLTYNGDKYYMGYPDAPLSGLMYNWGWMTEYEDTYYFGADGIMKTGWFTINGETYYFGSDGVMRQGKFFINGNCYIFDTDGKMVTGWYELNGDIYFLGDDGVAMDSLIDMSPYVQSRFNAAGILIEDIMKDKQPTGAVKDEYNVRMADTIIENGYRKANAEVSFQYLPNDFRTIGLQMMEYYNNNSNNTVKMTECDFGSANIAFAIDNTGLLDSNVYGATYSTNANDEWFNGDTYLSTEVTAFNIGFITFSAIFINPNANDLSNNGKTYLIRHEIGHALGLRHPFEISEFSQQTDFEASLMFPFWTEEDGPIQDYAEYASVTFQNYDINELNKTYPNEIIE